MPNARDVARALGVSVKTVSNAYGRPDQLSAGLRERIFATAAELGYAGPDPKAAVLRKGRAGAIGVAYANRLSYAFDDPAARAVLAGMTSVADSARTGLLLLPGSADPDDRARALSTAVIDGLVAYSVADDDPLLHTAVERRLPLVVIDQPRLDGVPWVGVDNRTAAAELAAHVRDQGHRRVGVVSFGLHRSPVRGLVDLRTTEVTLAVSRDRLLGFQEVFPEMTIFQGTDSTPEEGEAAALALLRAEPRPTALLCLSDRLAEGAFRAARGLGLDVPRDLSVTGFDDAEPTAAALGLTTVRQPHRRKGELAAQLLLGIGRPDTSLATELVHRTSVAPPQSLSELQ